jgi:hypothetical protein
MLLNVENLHSTFFAQKKMASIICQSLDQKDLTSITPKMTTLSVQHQPWIKSPEELSKNVQ